MTVFMLFRLVILVGRPSYVHDLDIGVEYRLYSSLRHSLRLGIFLKVMHCKEATFRSLHLEMFVEVKV